jgi:hypothetical protein
VGKATGGVIGAADTISNSGSYSTTLEISIYPSMIYDNYYAFTLFSLIISMRASACANSSCLCSSFLIIVCYVINSASLKAFSYISFASLAIFICAFS